jgi:hypothetical protein
LHITKSGIGLGEFNGDIHAVQIVGCQALPSNTKDNLVTAKLGACLDFAPHFAVSDQGNI